eukprot:1546561-Alexandrium_andersonii.AAC.1
MVRGARRLAHAACIVRTTSCVACGRASGAAGARATVEQRVAKLLEVCSPQLLVASAALAHSLA